VPVDAERRRVLLAARPTEAVELQSLFAHAALESWEPLQTDTFENARFLLQHNPCDILLVDESLYQFVGQPGLAWLAQQREAPTVFLTGMEPVGLAQAYEHGVSLCLPRRLTLDNPALLAAALNRVAQIREMQRCQGRAKESLHQCRRHVDRLVNLLWRSVPMDPQCHWFSQRHILERLQEEVSRSKRFGSVFTVALGEVRVPTEERSEADANELVEWVSKTIAGAKRRCDVAGHYGLQGFLLLMVQTPGSGGAAGCRRLQKQLQESVQPPHGPRGPIRACFGLSSFDRETTTSQSLLSRAEKHLEAARAGCGAGVVAEEDGAPCPKC
jgi:GGDEF domain-containing protein